MVSVQAEVKSEIYQLSDFYQVKNEKASRLIDTLILDRYTEFVLKEQGFDVIIGATGIETTLCNLSRQAGVEPVTLSAFRQLASRFPGRMCFLKLSFDQRQSAPVLFTAVIEPWSYVIDFLQSVPGINLSPVALELCTSQSDVCFMMAFSSSDSGQLRTRAYYLTDRKDHPASDPVLASVDLSEPVGKTQYRSYRMGVDWKDAAAEEHWEEIISSAREIISDKHSLCVSSCQKEKTPQRQKLYVLRHDYRKSINNPYQLSDYNPYYEEGTRLLRENFYHEAIRSFSNAVCYKSDDALALNSRGFCYIQLKEFGLAVEDCKKARMLDERIPSQNLDYALLHYQNQAEPV